MPNTPQNFENIMPKNWKNSSATVFTDFSLKELQNASNSMPDSYSDQQ